MWGFQAHTRRRTWLVSTLLVALLVTNIGIFAPRPANAGFFEDVGKGVGDFVGGVGQVVGDVGKGIGDAVDGVGKFVAPIGDQLKAITQVKIPGTDAIIDLTAGFSSIQQKILATLPDEIPVPIPGMNLKLYTKESPASNVIKNLVPMLGGIMGAVDPWRPIASLARTVIQIAKPFFDDHIKPYLPGFLKGGAYAVKEFIKNSLKAIENPILTNIIFPVWDFFVGPFDDLAMDIVELLAEEQHEPPPPDDPRNWAPGTEQGEKMKGSVGIAGDPIPYVDPIKPQSPIGSFDGIDGDGVVYGWAVDQDTLQEAVDLSMEIDGVPAGGLSAFANEDSPAGDAQKYQGKHGFRYTIPSKWRDAKSHSMVVKAFDTATGGVWSPIITLSGSPKAFTISQTGRGSLDGISDSGIITGWAVDLDSPGGPDVEIYLDGQRGAGGALVGTVKANISRSDFGAESLGNLGIASNAIGYSLQVDKARLTGGRHTISAYVKDVNAVTGAVDYRELPITQAFYIPEGFPLQFGPDPLIVAQGRWAVTTIRGLPSAYHQLSATLDGVSVDLHAYERAVTPYAYRADDKALIISAPGKTTEATLRIKIPLDFPLGDHAVKLATDKAMYQFYTPDHFTIRVVAPSGLKITSADTITAGSDTDIILSNIPATVTIGSGGNAFVRQVILGATVPGYEDSTYETYRVGLTNIRTTTLSDQTVKITAHVPPEANTLRKERGPIRVYVEVEATERISREEFLVAYPYQIITRG